MQPPHSTVFNISHSVHMLKMESETWIGNNLWASYGVASGPLFTPLSVRPCLEPGPGSQWSLQAAALMSARAGGGMGSEGCYRKTEPLHWTWGGTGWPRQQAGSTIFQKWHLHRSLQNEEPVFHVEGKACVKVIKWEKGQWVRTERDEAWKRNRPAVLPRCTIPGASIPITLSTVNTALSWAR